MIFLAITPPNGKEVHIKWDQQKDIISAKNEINEIRSSMIAQNKYPYDCFIYEAEIPEYDNKAYTLDEIDMNFYEERTKEEIEKDKKEMNNIINVVKKLADEEKAKFG